MLVLEWYVVVVVVARGTTAVLHPRAITLKAKIDVQSFAIGQKGRPCLLDQGPPKLEC